MIPPPPPTKLLTDAHGQEHEWQCEPFATREALNLLATILDIVIGSDRSGVLDTDLADLKTKFAAGFGALPRRLLDAGGADLIHRVLRGCRRREGGGWVDLSNVATFDAVGRGNLLEVLSAAWWALEVNYGPLSEAVMSGLGGLSALTGDPSPIPLIDS